MQVPNMQPANNPFKTNMSYDLESVHNVYSYAAYLEKSNRIIIRYKTDDTLILTPEVIEEIKYRLYRTAKVTLDRHFDSYPGVDIAVISPEEFFAFTECPSEDEPYYRIGYNTIAYDQTLLAVMKHYYQHYNQLPEPNTVRTYSDLLIDFKRAVGHDRTLMQACNAQRINIYKRLSHRRVISFIDKYRQATNMSVTPTLNSVYQSFTNSGQYLDLMVINESDKQSDSDGGAFSRPSMKRLAAQLGLRIEEPDDVDLSDSKKDISIENFITLMVYNVIDILVTHLIYKTEDISDSVSLREKLLERFKSNYANRLNVNSTSAKFVEYVIQPQGQIEDKPCIEFFYPIFGTEHDRIRNIIAEQYPKDATLAEIRQIDARLTAALQNQPGYEPITPGVPRFRVSVKELQEDLLERLKAVHPNTYSEDVYEFYSFFRNATSPEDAFSAIREKYPEPKNDNWVYFNKKDKYTGEILPRTSINYNIPDTDVVLTYSYGGLHGDVKQMDAYRIKSKFNKDFNTALELTKQYYPDAGDLFRAVAEDTLPEELASAWLNNETLNALIHKKRQSSKKATVVPDAPKTPYEYAICLAVDDESSKRAKVAGIYGGHYRNAKKLPNLKLYTKIVDLINVIHADVDSLYPSLVILLRIFAKWNEERHDWDDVYRNLRDERLELKEFAHRIPEEEWTAEEFQAEFTQLQNKRLINSATGQAAATSSNNIQAVRSIASMRIDGQLILSDLVLTVAEHGGESVSTNTDGVYLTNIDIDLAKQLVKVWREYYGIGAKPEIMHRFISKDSNNRFEQFTESSNGHASGGTISNFAGKTITKKMSQPSIIDETIIAYFKSHTDIPNETHCDVDFIKDYLTKRYQEILSATENTDEVCDRMLSFAWSMQPSSGKRYLLKRSNEYLAIQKVNRMLLCKGAHELIAVAIGKPASKISEEDAILTDVCYDLGLIKPEELKQAKRGKVSLFDDNWRVCRVNEDISFYFQHPVWKTLDIDAYVDFVVQRISVWHSTQFDEFGDPIKPTPPTTTAIA